MNAPCYLTSKLLKLPFSLIRERERGNNGGNDGKLPCFEAKSSSLLPKITVEVTYDGNKFGNFHFFTLFNMLLAASYLLVKVEGVVTFCSISGIQYGITPHRGVTQIELMAAVAKPMMMAAAGDVASDNAGATHGGAGGPAGGGTDGGDDRGNGGRADSRTVVGDGGGDAGRTRGSEYGGASGVNGGRTCGGTVRGDGGGPVGGGDVGGACGCTGSGDSGGAHDGACGGTATHPGGACGGIRARHPLQHLGWPARRYHGGRARGGAGAPAGSGLQG